MTEQLRELLRQFRIETDNWELFNTYELFDGHINKTYVLETQQQGAQRRYVLQNINTYVFKRPAELMENIVRVTQFLRERLAAGEAPGQTTLTVYPARSGEDYHIDESGGYWRCYNFVENSFSPHTADETVAEKAGHAFGMFQRLLNDFPIDQLHETIPDFHHTAKRYEALEAAIAANTAGRRDEVAAEISFARARKNDCAKLVDMCGAGELPQRVTHNDTKLNNVLFDKDTNEAVCVIDFDTIMPGLSLYDYGDALRFLGNAAAEDERDLSKVQFVMPLFRAYTKGYLQAAASALTPAEIRMLPFSIKLLTLECGMRFLTDYLNGDVYFRIHKPDDNLARCRTQFKLVEEIERHMDEMNAYIASL